MRRFLAEEQGDTTTGVALGAILVLLLIVAVVWSGLFARRTEQPGIEIRVGT